MDLPLVAQDSNLHFVAGPRNGPTLLLLHGVARNWRDWEPLLPALMEQWHVVAVDHLGHGQSPRGPSYRVTDYAREVREFIRLNFSEPLTVLGHSLGAMVALDLAAECDELVSHVVLEDPPFHTMGRQIHSTPFRAQFAGMQNVVRQELRDVEAIADALAEIRLPSPTGEVRLGDVRDRESLRFLAECLRHVDPEIFTPLVAGEWLDGFEYESMWPRVTCPALLLQGDPNCGGLLTEDDVATAMKFLQRGEVRRFDQVGHQIHRSRLQEVLDLLQNFAH